ncbi:MAG: homoserine kinase, partial [Bdellovibrionota bacterium]
MTKLRATAFAPASVANVAVGFDVLGFSTSAAGDKVTVEKIDSHSIEIVSVQGVVTKVPTDPAKNTATAGLLRMQSELGLKFGFRVSIEKGIPLGSGMGGSAASAVASVVAANALLDQPLTPNELLSYALVGEAQASGSYHADNVAPSLLGGLTIARVRSLTSLPRVEAISLPVPDGVFCVLVHPQLVVETKAARGVLKADVHLKAHVEQLANLAGFVAACYRNDVALLRASLHDLVIEPQRAHLILGFSDVKDCAMKAGAIGCSISGAGPSVFAWVEGQKQAE